MTEATAPRPVPLLLLGQARRERLRDRVAAAALAWQRAWASEGAAPPVVEVLPGPGIRPRAAGMEPLMLAAAFLEDELLLHAQAGPDLVKSLCVPGGRDGARLAFGADHGALEVIVAEEALRALCDGMIRAAMLAAACVLNKCGPATLEEAGAAWQKRAITLTIGSGRMEGGAGIELHAAPRLADALAGARPALAKAESLAARRRAADAERVFLTVTVGSASVGWGDLSVLSIGDAVVLDQQLGSPCIVSAAGAKAIAEAQLGRTDSSLAVQITRVLAASAARTPSREH